MKKKSSFLKKAVKAVLWTLGCVVALVVLLVATLPLWVGPVVRPAVNAVAPKFTKTAFSIGHLALNPYTGRLEVGDFLLGNPEGYSDPRAVELGKLVVDVDMATVASDVIRVEELTVDGCFVSYSVGGTNGIDNISQILMNVSGEADDDEEEGEAQDDAPPAEAEGPAEGEAAEEVADGDDGTPAKEIRVIIDRVTVRGVKVNLQGFTIPVPNMEFKDVGSDVGGVAPADVAGLLWDRILKGATGIGDGISALGGLLGDGAGAASGAVSDGAGAAADAVGEGAKKAADAVGEGAKKTADAVKNLLGL